MQKDKKEFIDVGAMLRELREEKGLTLREVCRKAHLSPSHLSSLERDKISPSLATLRKVIKVLGLDLESFFSRSAQRNANGFLFRREDMRSAADRYRRYTFVLPKRKDIKAEVLDEYFIPGETKPEFETLDCDISAVILSGIVELEIEKEKKEILRSGDGFHIPAGKRHRGRCVSSEPAHLITVYVPPRY